MKIKNLLIGTIAASILGCAGVSLAGDDDVKGNIRNLLCKKVLVLVDQKNCCGEVIAPEKLRSPDTRNWAFIDFSKLGLKKDDECKRFILWEVKDDDGKNPKRRTFVKISVGDDRDQRKEVDCRVIDGNGDEDIRCVRLKSGDKTMFQVEKGGRN